MSHANASIEISAPMKDVFEVISDFESYPEFLQETQSVAIDKKSGKNLVVTFTITMIKKITYTLDIKLTPPNGLSWKLIRGDMMKSNTGHWKLTEVKKDLTKAEYHIDMDLGGMVPKALTNKLVGTNLPAMLKQFRDRIHEVSPA